MRRLLAALMLVAAIAVPAVAATGCGSDDLPSVSVADAAQATRDAHTARATFRIEMSGMGLPVPMTMTAEGITATDDARMDLTFDFGPILEAAGAGGDAEARVIVDGRRAYAEPPDIEGFELPGGANWVTIDLFAIVKALDFDPEGFAELFRMSPQQQLDALRAAGAVEEVGEEEIDGVRTTHLRGTVSLRDYAAGLPADRRRDLEAAIRKVAKLTGEDPDSFDEPTPTDMWVDEDAHIRRMTSKAAMPAQDGVPAGSLEMTTEFKDFGTPLELDPPEGDDVYNATDDVVRMIREAF